MRTMWSATVFGAAALLILAGSAGAGVVVSGGGLALVEEGGSFASGNLAAGSAGATPFAIDDMSSTYPVHATPHLNDVTYGNNNSWIGRNPSPTLGKGFAGIDLGGLKQLDSIAYGRSSTGPHTDRCLGLYTLQYTNVPNPDENTPDAAWQSIGTLDYQSAGGTNFGQPALRHRYTFDPVAATAVRLAVPYVWNQSVGLATCIDEVELYGGDVQIQLQATGGGPCPNNLATRPGATAFALNCIGGYTSHAIDHLNDGLYGNTSSWIGISGPSFAGIDLNGPATINAIAFGRDNGGEPPERPEPYPDRWAGTYTLQYTTIASPDETTPDADWVTIGTLTYDSTFPDATPYLRHVWMFDTIDGVTGVRVLTGTNGTCIDELEVCFIPEPATLALVAGGLLALVRRRAARR